MQLGRVIGNATSTVKHPSMQGWRLLVIQPLGPDGHQPDGDPVLAVDRMNAGVGELAIISSDGRGTREMLKDETTPVRWAVLGVCDGK